MAATQIIHGLEMGEARRPDLALIGLIRPVRDQINAEFPFWRLDGCVSLAGRHVIAFSIELEVVDERFHRALHLAPLRRHDLVVEHRNRPLPFRRTKLLDALLHDRDRLAHLLHADAIAVITVPVLADRDVEIELGIALVRLRFAQVPDRARAAHHHTGKAPGPRVLEAHHTDIDVALFENAIVGQQLFDVVADLEEWIAESPDVIDQLRRQILVHPAWAEKCCVHTAAGGALVKDHQFFAFLETPQGRRECPDIQGLGGHIEEVRQQPPDLAIEYADELGALGDRNPQEPLRRQAERVLLVHRGDIVEPIEIGDRLQIGLVLDQFLGAAMQEPDVRIDALHQLPVELEHEA